MFFLLQMSALKSANKELKGMMKTVKIQDIDVFTWLALMFLITFHFVWSFLEYSYVENWFIFHFFQNLQDEMMDLMDVSNEIQESLGRSYSVPDDIDEEELMGGKFIVPYTTVSKKNLSTTNINCKSRYYRILCCFYTFLPVWETIILLVI